MPVCVHMQNQVRSSRVHNSVFLTQVQEGSLFVLLGRYFHLVSIPQRIHTNAWSCVPPRNIIFHQAARGSSNIVFVFRYVYDTVYKPHLARSKVHFLPSIYSPLILRTATCCIHTRSDLSLIFSFPKLPITSPCMTHDAVSFCCKRDDISISSRVYNGVQGWRWCVCVCAARRSWYWQGYGGGVWLHEAIPHRPSFSPCLRIATWPESTTDTICDALYTCMCVMCVSTVCATAFCGYPCRAKLCTRGQSGRMDFPLSASNTRHLGSAHHDRQRTRLMCFALLPVVCRWL
jgi:hypothetical protein